jgi:VIT1/CCC1 family predicted Fe2+/Mn2+ transporter
MLSCLALFAIGAVLSIFSARGPILSGLRMLGIGLLASGVTFTAGWIFGVTLAG